MPKFGIKVDLWVSIPEKKYRKSLFPKGRNRGVISEMKQSLAVEHARLRNKKGMSSEMNALVQINNANNQDNYLLGLWCRD